MNVKRFFGANSREAMAKVRAALGGEAIILKNRPVDGGVEILAMADVPPDLDDETTSGSESLVSGNMTAREQRAGRSPSGQGASISGREAERAPRTYAPNEEPMSTVSFQQFVRERIAQSTASSNPVNQASAAARARLHEPPSKPDLVGSDGMPLASARQRFIASQSPTDSPAQARMAPAVVTPAPARPPVQSDPIASRGAIESLPVAHQATPARQAPALRPAPTHVTAHRPVQAPDQGVTGAQAINAALAEIRSVKGLINTRLTSLAWVEGVRRNPAQSRLIRIMVASGMSTRLARHLAEKMPAHYNEDEGDRWLRAALNHFLKVDAPSETILDRGGIYALIGPTGVGKTTSAAKIAALAALRYGSDSIGLITVDAYRMGAMDQLRAFGQLIGSPVHVARDGLELLKGLRGLLNRKIVLIDTVGVGQRDARVGELLTSIAMPSIKKLVVLNAATQSETIEDVVRAYRAQDAAGVILTKLDEAVKTGGVLDCVIRNKLTVCGVADGQRVPEDWRWPDRAALIERALLSATSEVDHEDAEMSMIFGAGGSAGRHAASLVPGSY